MRYGFVLVAALVAVGIAAGPASGQTPDFGDNASDWAFDGECDDPRFVGDGADDVLLEKDRMHDAADCRAAFEAGRIRLRASIPPSEIYFGDNSSRWANDFECDDPRFEGEGADEVMLAHDRGHDANDCRALYEAGRVQLRSGETGAPIAAEKVSFGDDSSRWARDGECDDPRFEGPGMDETLLEEDRLRDATDCRALYDAFKIRLR